MSEPLFRLLKKGRRFLWDEDQQKSFEMLKVASISASTLVRPDFSLPFTSQTDATSTESGAILTQLIEGAQRVIAYASRTMAASERHFTVTGQECLAVILAVRKFRPYLQGYSFLLVTDHNSLRWLCKLKDTTGRLGRWATDLLGNHVTIKYRKGALHHVSDARSRMFETDTEAVSTIAEKNKFWYLRRIKNVQEMPSHFLDLKVEGGDLYFHRPNTFFDSILNDLEAWKIVLPSKCRCEVLKESHDATSSGHIGVEKINAHLSLTFHPPDLILSRRN